MKTIIKATAPTAYQLNSLIAFRIGYTKLAGGSYQGVREFESLEAAKKHLKACADAYNDDDPCGSEERLADMYADIEKGHLTLDAVKASIETVEEEGEDDE